MLLAALIYGFLLSWLIGVPKRIYKIFRNIVSLVNNEVAFVLNLKLLFTPLFGDFSIIGRLIGVVYRLIRILIGFVVIICVLCVGTLSFLTWFILPFLLIYYIGIPFLISIPLGFLFFTLYRLTTPEKKAREIKEEKDLEKAFNFSQTLPKKYQRSKYEFFTKFFAESKIVRLLYFTELLGTDFYRVFSDTVSASSIELLEIEKESLRQALENKSRYVELEHVFLALVKLTPSYEKMLATYSINFDLLKEAAYFLVSERDLLSKIYFWQEDFEPSVIGGVNRGWTARVTPVLNSVSSDFTKMAQKGYFDKVVGKEKAITSAIEILERTSNKNVLVIGEPGSGKTTMIKGIAQEIISGSRSSALAFKRLVAIDTGSLIAGCATPGELSEKLTKIIKEIEASGNIIIFIDEVHSLVASNGGNAELATVFNTLIPYLENDSFQMIGATTVAEYRKYIEPNGSFSRLFNVVNLEEATDFETLEILKVLTKKYEKVHGVSISFLALKKIIELSKKLIRDRVLPDKAVLILERACVSKAKATKKYVTSETIAAIVSDITKIPVTQVTEDESKKLLNIENELKKRVIGQEDAIYQIGDSLRRSRAGIRDEKRPIASFLFVGSTGVGKTETAKAVAQTYFGSEDTMIRLDMSEYQQDASIDKLIGSPNETGVITEKVRRSPFALILLDEIEKASSKVLLAFLQVLDDGRLSDGTGRVIDFSNAIIIATSNVGTAKIQQVAARNGTYEEMKREVMIEVRNRFAPEFLNRFSSIITFKPLELPEIKKITLLLLNRISKAMEQKSIKITFNDKLVLRLSQEGFDKEWGARPLRRLIENTVESYVARRMLTNEITAGSVIELGEEVFG